MTSVFKILEPHATLDMEVRPFYKTNDSAHQLGHAREVAVKALGINGYLGTPYPAEVVAAAAYYHDIRVDDRDEHHLLAGTHIDEKWDQSPALSKLTAEQRKDIANACREHRASFKGTYSSLLSEIVSAADRSAPGCGDAIQVQIDRAVRYGTEKEGMSPDEALRHGYSHIKEKYGTNGYARLNSVFRKYYAKELKEFQIAVDELVCPVM